MGPHAVPFLKTVLNLCGSGTVLFVAEQLSHDPHLSVFTPWVILPTWGCPGNLLLTDRINPSSKVMEATPMIRLRQRPVKVRLLGDRLPVLLAWKKQAAT